MAIRDCPLNPVDLHCHTTASDGALSPLQLCTRAVQQGVTLLAITDHDTVAGHRFLATRRLPAGLQLITGMELSTVWSGTEIHVVGLHFPLHHPDLDRILHQQSQARRQRALYIADRLAARLEGITAGALLQAVLTQAKQAQRDSADGFRLPDAALQIGRPHFAQWLVAHAKATNTQAAFNQYLSSQRLGKLRRFWPAMSQGVAWIRALGGTAVLAHPSRYGMTRTRLQALVKDFKQAGGHALEVASCQIPPNQVQQLAALCRTFALKASQGSDFHQPGRPWLELGRLPALPKTLPTVWAGWQ